MAPDERIRFEMHERLTQQFGPDMADYLMQIVPPFGRHEIATKSDLEDGLGRLEAGLEGLLGRVEAGLEGRLVRLEERLQGFEERAALRFQASDERMTLRFQASDEKAGRLLQRQFNRMLMWLLPTVIVAITAASAIASAVR